MAQINLKTKKLNLKNLDLAYSRLLNQQISLEKIKKLNSNTQIVQEKSLKSRVADITKLNANLNLLTSQNKLNIIENKSIQLDNGKVKAELKILNNSISLTSTTPKNNMLDNYISYKQSKRQKLASLTNPNNKFKIKKCLQTIYGLPYGWRELALSKDLVYNFNNNIKKFKLDSILENSFYSMNSLTGTKIYEMTPNNLTLQLFYYTKNKFNIRYDYLQYLCTYISKKIKKPFKLNLIKLRNLKSDSVLSAKAIGIVANKILFHIRPIAQRFLGSSRIINPKMIKNVFYTKKRGLNKLSFCTGINIKLGGRLRGQSLTNRETTITFQNGSLNRVSSDILTSSRFTTKSIRGAYSITVTMGHKFF